MQHDVSSEDLLRQYLLGQLSEDVQERVEERLMTDSSFSDQLSAIEEDLVDDYVAGRLNGAEKTGFEALFLAHPKRRGQVEFASALRRYAVSAAAASVTPVRHPMLSSAFFDFIRGQNFAFKTALTTTVLAVLLGGAWLIFEVARLNQQLAGLREQQTVIEKERGDLARKLENERSRRSEIEEELAAAKKPAKPEAGEPKPGEKFIALTLLPGLVRDSGALPRLVFPPGKDIARLELLLENGNYMTYNAILQTAEGMEVWKRTGLRGRTAQAGSVVVVELPRDVLRPQDYAVKLSGTSPDGGSEAVGTYYFRFTQR